MGFELSRRALVAGSAAAGVTLAAARAVAAADDRPLFALVPRPTRIFKTRDHSHENTESWIFSLVVQTLAPAALTPAALRIDLLKAGKSVRRTEYPADG